VALQYSPGRRKGITVRRGESEADLEAFYVFTRRPANVTLLYHPKTFIETCSALRQGDHVAPYSLGRVRGTGRCWHHCPLAGPLELVHVWSSSNEHVTHAQSFCSGPHEWAKSKVLVNNFPGHSMFWEEDRSYGAAICFQTWLLWLSLRFLETNDPLSALLYEAYRRLLDVKRWRDADNTKSCGWRHQAKKLSVLLL